MKWQGHWLTALHMPCVTSHLVLRLGPSLLVWSGGQLSLTACSSWVLWRSIYCCCCRRLSRCLQQSYRLRFRTAASDTLADREGRQGVGQAVWGLHGGGVERGATCGRGGRNRSEESTREGNWDNRGWKERRTDKNIINIDFLAFKHLKQGNNFNSMIRQPKMASYCHTCPPTRLQLMWLFSLLLLSACFLSMHKGLK